MRNNAIHNTQIYNTLPNLIPDSIKLIANINSFENIDCMFLNPNKIDAISWWCTKDELKMCKEKKLPIAVFKNHGHYVIPEYLSNYPYLYIINLELK